MSLDKLRELPEFKGASDAEIISTLAKTTQQPLADVASAFGMDVGGKWGNRLSASVDSYQAGLLGLGETVFGSKTLGDMRRRNEADAELSRSIAQKQGAIMSYKDIGGVGDFFDYAGGLAVDSAPYLAESLAGGLVARGLSTGLRGVAAAGRAADATTDAVRAGMAAEKALATRATLGGVAASYPSSVGDILQNQRDEAGTTDLGAAALGGIPYAALNAFGLEGALAKGKLARSGIQALDNVGGLRGGLLRTGASALKSAAPEGLSETGQELINQSFGRMAVNPDQTLFNPEANERYLESFVGGATLGGVFGGAAGGWRRSEGYLPPGQKLDDPSAPANLLGSQGELFNDLGDEGKVSWLPQEPQDQDGALVARYQELRTAASQLESGMAAAEAAKDRDRFYQLQEQHLAVLREMEPLERTYSAIVAERQSPGQMGLFGSGERDSGRPAFALSGYGPEEGPLYGTIDATGAEPLSPQPGQMNLLSGVFQTVGGQPVELTSDELRAGGLYENRQNNLFTDPNPLQQRIDQNLGIGTRNTPRNYPSQFQAAASEPTNLFAVNPENNLETQLDVGQVSALQAGDTSQLTPVQARAKAVGAAAAQEKQTIEGRRERAAMVGLDPKNTKHVQAWGYIEDALDNGTIDQDEAARLAANVSAGIDKVGGIQKYLVAKAQQQEITAQANATETQTLIDNLKTKTNGTQTAQAVQGQTQESETLPAGTAVRGANVQASATPGTPAASTRGGLPAEGRSDSLETTGAKTVTIGRKGREKTVDAQQLSTLLKNAPKKDQQIILAAMGVDIDTNPTTGAPMLVARPEGPASYEEVGKLANMTRAGVQASLAKYGINEEVINRVAAAAAPDSVSESELGINPEENGSGFRVETQLSKATGQGLIDDGVGETTAQRKTRAEADNLLKKSGTAVAKTNANPVATAEGRQQAEAITNRNIEAARQAPWADEARDMWNPDNMEATDLPDTLAADYVLEYGLIKQQEGGLTREALIRINRLQNEIEDEYQQLLKYSPDKARAGTSLAGPTGGQTDQAGIGSADQRGQRSLETSTRAQPASEVTDVEEKPVTPFTGVISSNEQEASSKPAQSAAQPQNASVVESARQPGPGQQKESVAGRSGQADRGVTTAEVVANLKEFLRKDALGRKVIVVQSVSDLPKGVRVSSKSKTQGMAIDDGPYGRVAYLIADNLTRDNIRAVFMHEVGSHLALDNMLNTQAMANLVEQIKNWAKLGVGGSTKQEHVLAAAAARRVQKSVKNPEHYRSELLAYFIEEAMGAGVTPTAIQTDKRSPLMAFLRKALALFKDIAAELGVSAKDITAQDIVDLAYGAAQLEMADTGPVASGESLTRENAKFSKAAQTAEGFGRKVAGETGARVAVDASNLAGKVLGSLTYLHDIVESAKSKLPSAEKWYKATMDIQASRNRMAQEAERIVQMFTDSDVNAEKVNKMLFDATFDQKWPYDSQRMNRTTGEMETVKADPALAARFKAELNDKERAVVKAVFDHGERALARKYEILKKLGLNGVFKNETGKLQGPYAPLKRFGNYISVLKSADLVAAEKANDEGLVEKLKSDPKHYEVRFHDTKGLANEYALANAKDWAESYHFEKSERVGQAMPMSASVLRNIRAALEMEGDLPPESIRHFEEMLQNLEFQALDEHHARTSGLTRKNRAGAEADMMRSFLANARAQSNFLAQLEFGKEANQQFYAMQKEAQRNRHAGQDDFNLIAKHYAASFDNRDTLLSRIDSRVTGFTTMMQLATSVGYHITNMLQGVMVTVPKLAGDFGNYTGAMDSLMTGYKTWSQGGGAKGRFDINSVKDAGLRAVLQRAADMGVLDVGMTEDLSQFESFRTGYKGIDAASSGLSKMMHKLNQVARYVETANRVSAATAAYKMAMEKYKDQAKAQEYAVRVLQTTQGDFSMSGAPLIFKKMPRFVMQYKKYQFMMASLYANAFKQALRGATPEERAIGRRFLAYKLTTSSVAAGALGLPLINVAALVFGMTGDDDEPRDLERSLRNMIGDEDLADIILRGPLNAIGLDMSAKLGDDKIFSISPYTDIDFSTGANAAKTIVGIAGGPAASQVMRMANGVEYLSKGEMQKGFENLVPSGLANASKAYRIANEGYTLKNGTIMFSPDEISGLTLWADAIGLKSSQMKHMDYVRGQQYEIGQFFSDRTKDLKASYVQAYRDGDTKEMGELADHWMKLQQAKRELRQMFNNSSEELKTQPLSSLLKAPANAVKRDMKAQKASW